MPHNISMYICPIYSPLMQNKNIDSKFLIVAIITSMFLWGLSWPSGKVLAGYCTAINFSVYRYIIVIVTLLCLLFAMKVRLWVKKEGIPSLLISGVLLAIYSYFFFIGIKNGSAGAGGVLVTTLNPIMAYTIGIFINRKLPTRNESAGLILGVAAGSILLQVWSNTHAIFESGNIYFLIASLTWAVMSKFTSKGARYGASAAFSFWQYLITLLCLLPLMDVHEFQLVSSIKDALFWGNLVFSAAIVTALATTIYFYATTKLGAEKASSFIFLLPLAAAVSTWLLLGEHIKLNTIIGGALGMAAVYMINRKARAEVNPE